jgi:hypothetical protein
LGTFRSNPTTDNCSAKAMHFIRFILVGVGTY